MTAISWTEQARSDVRRLDKTSAMRILHSLHRFAKSGTGDLKVLQGESGELRLRVGDYRVIFVKSDEGALEIRRVLHRSEAYR